MIPCLCDQAEWPDVGRLEMIQVRPNPRPHPLIFKVCANCRYVVGMEDPDPDEKLDRASPTVQSIARLLRWKLPL